MEDVCLREYSENEYDEYYKRLRIYRLACKIRIEDEQESHLQKIKNIKKRKRIALIVSAILLIVVSGIITVLLDLYCFPDLDNFQYMQMTNGKDIVCYVTDYGNSYHKSGCRYLRSSNKTTMYEAERMGYKPCSVCWTYPKVNWKTVKGVNYFNKTVDLLKWILPITIVLYIFICVKIFRHFKDKIFKEETNFADYKRSIKDELIDTYGEEDIFIKAAKSLSGVPLDVDYKNGLPYTEDDRYIVYKSDYGKCFHSNKHCRGHYMTTKIHSFVAINFLEPCYYCSELIDIPYWHENFTNLYKTYKSIITMCE